MCFKYFCLVLSLLNRNIENSSFENCNTDKLEETKSLELSQHSEISDCTLYEKSEIYIDPWGKELNWYDTDDGWNEKRRQAVIFERERNMLQSKRMPAYTNIGYAVMKIPSQLYELIHEAKAESKIVTEACDEVHQNCARVMEDGTLEMKNNTQMLKLQDTSLSSLIETEVLLSLRPILETWSGQKLSRNHVLYGIRRYLRGASFMSHVDRLPTHIISAILQIDQKVDTEWPLTVIDHNGRKDKVYLKKGEMVLYESAKVMHGRQFHLDGDFFENLFIHFTIEKDYAKYKAISEETLVKKL